ncbi:glutamyl-Q tRNA(Asp) ligase [Rhizobium sp. Root274]|uniref:tRNA glutamyl-Q(34) synthetase GluQRS n=1 Tax=unclassified Rhizobium TaxID=2613769 RepID=UPI00071587E3|nr:MULTISPECIES: tRNA glutamyl-Q(34) synthetase GluQRS [unclassified Rhizobium]KQW28136.1 glutamyl-Q tRNA(Asp) ligase [Rhizobium sp. Root1240]KRD28422.1 glutamyl-Q tRNA(Asp) ligase [Rhizobium sp. Root274]
MAAAPRQIPVFRFAPSPNGRLHLGHALSALLNAQMASETGGRLLLRIEDIDLTRCTPELEQRVLADLDWLGLVYERPVRRQSEHFDLYRAALDQLIARGLVYPAFLTRGEVKARVADVEARGAAWPRDPDGAPLYPTDERHLSAKEQAHKFATTERHALRLDMEKALAAVGHPLTWQETGDSERGEVAAEPAAWGDVVLWRSDAPASYHLAVTVDDAAQGVTHVVRGLDLFHATSVHRLLQDLLGLPQPVYHHHRLILGPDGRKLSKSAGDTALASLRAEGKTPSDIRAMVGI